MKIRKEQMDEFDAERRKEFEDKLLPHLQEAFPNECEQLGEDGVRERIRTGIDAAEQYGITTDRYVADYIELMFMASPEFDSEPWAKEVLERTDNTSYEKMCRIRHLAGQRAAARKRRGGGRERASAPPRRSGAEDRAATRSPEDAEKAGG